MDHASRGAPPKVLPVVIDGVRYSQVLSPRRVGIDAFGGGWMVANDDETGDLLWTLRVYGIAIDPGDETDIQEVYFKSMTRVAGRHALLVRNEDDAAFEVDLDTHSVTPVK